MKRAVLCLLSGALFLAWAQPGPRPPAARGMALEGPLVRIPSTAAGESGLWVRIAPPARPRYPEGAPVVVHVPGGFTAGGLTTSQARLGDRGFVDIVFLFPGGESGPPRDGRPLRSGGAYDSRGPASVRALADVLRFAHGRLRSLEGKTVDQYVAGMKVLTAETGVIGWSLGGTTIAAALGLHGAELPALRWYASHESPYGEGVIDGEFGTHAAANPFYDAATGQLDLRTLRYAADVPVRNMGRPIPGAPAGALYLDADGNGRFDPGADFAFSGIYLPGPPPNVHYSPMLTRAAIERKVFGATWPAHIANLEQTNAAWRIRDGVTHVPAAVRHLPQLAVIVFAAEVDHVQATADHRHILLQYGAFRDAGVRWIRLNPDPLYVARVLGRPVDGAPDNRAGAAFDRVNIGRALMPEPPRGPADPLALMAAACELADRTHKGEWSASLPAVLYPDAP